MSSLASAGGAVLRRLSPAVQADVFHAMGPLLRAVREAPHRDVTHRSYADCFTTYVQVLGQIQRTLEHPPTHEPTAFAAWREGVLHHAKTTLNAVLLSSLLARRWEEVYLPSPATTSAPAGEDPPHAWWFIPPGDGMEGGGRREVVTAMYLAEPLLGGRALRRWMEDLRRPDLPDSARETAEIILPFSSLWCLKEEAHARPGPGGAGRALSLQARSGRQTVLRSIHQLLQLEAEARRRSSGEPIAPPLRLRVWSPTDEFDALCQIPELKRRWAGSASSPAASSPACLSLPIVLEERSARVRYLLLSAALRTDSAVAPASSVETASLWSVRAHPEEHRDLRLYGAPLACESDVPRQRGLLSVHAQALQSCGDVVRRLAAREENVRQSLSSS